MSVSTGHAFQTAARRLLQRPGHSLLAVAVLGVGLGTVLFLFGLVNGLVLKPMPFPDPDRLVAIGYKTENDVGIEVMGNDDYEQIRNSLKSIEATGIYHVQAADIVVGGVAKRYNGCLLSGQMLAFLGTTPLSGRRLGKSDERPGAPLVALISESLWRNDFAAAKDIIGRNVQINGEAATIVGVMPKGFAFPAIADVWLPTRFPPGTSTDVNVVGKLKPGVALGQARADLETVASAQGKQLRGQRAGRNLTVKPLALSFITEKVRSYAWLMFATSSLVLLLACANIGNLQLVQAMSRQRDLAIRCALGASRGRLLRDQLMESFVLSVAATLVALLIAQLGNDWIAGIFAANGKPPPYFIRFGIDGRMLVFAAIAALFTTAVAGFIPAWRASRTDVQEVLREGGKGSHGGFFARISKALVVFEIALTVILLVGAGTFIQGLERVLETKFGNAIDPERILTARIDLRQNRYPDQASRIRLYDQIGERLRSDPAIVNATLANTIPGALLGSHEYIAGLGQPRPAGGYLKAQLGVVDKHFAETYRLKLIVGRFFDERDAQNPVVVIDSETAALLWPGTDAIGQRIALHPEQENPDILTVIGVVSDLQLDGVSEDSLPSILLPMRQLPPYSMVIAAEIKGGDPLASASKITQAVSSIDPDIPVYDVRTQAKGIDMGRTSILVLTQVFTLLGLIALMLAAAGLYGILSFAVVQRTREIGIRRALGAGSKTIVSNIGRQLLLQLAIGLTIGIGLALPWSAALTDPKLQTHGDEGSVFAVVVLTIVVVAVVASLVPIARALRVDPIVALRYE
ncbi:ADOP family duplicated permease [Xanthomonas sp. MUS 060]|uniref:ADOP family duplicated permease n=1 Tax=Xanthomonas sp. MUS 060 TaxID=1588031 RepID=UPI0005F2F3E3|nr:ADOP family duplicated permease [Xanthomonas sp. MUS 060]